MGTTLRSFGGCPGDGSTGFFGTAQAIEFSVDVSDEDFMPPVEPQH